MNERLSVTMPITRDVLARLYVRRDGDAMTYPMALALHTPGLLAVAHAAHELMATLDECTTIEELRASPIVARLGELLGHEGER